MDTIKNALIGAFAAVVNLAVAIINFVFVTCLWNTLCVLIIWNGICLGFFRGIVWRRFLQHHWRRVLQWILLALPLATCGLLLWWYIYDYEEWLTTPPFNFVMGIVTFIVIVCGIGFFQEIYNYLKEEKRWLIAGLAVLFTAFCLIWSLIYHPSLLLVAIVWAVLMGVVIVLATKRVEFSTWVVNNWWGFILYLLAVVIFLAVTIHFGPMIAGWVLAHWQVFAGIIAIIIIALLIIANWDKIKNSRAWQYIRDNANIPAVVVVTIILWTLKIRLGWSWAGWLGGLLPILILVIGYRQAEYNEGFKKLAILYFVIWAIWFCLVVVFGVQNHGGGFNG